MSKGPKPRGVAGRNAGVKWILENISGNGVMYFADDDNTYDLRLFNEVSQNIARSIQLGLPHLTLIYIWFGS